MRQNKLKKTFLSLLVVLLCFSFTTERTFAEDLPQSDYSAYMFALDNAIANDLEGDAIFLRLFGITPVHPYFLATSPDYPDKLGSIIYDSHNDGIPLQTPSTPESTEAFASSYVDGMKAVNELDQLIQSLTVAQKIGFAQIYGHSVVDRFFDVVPGSPYIDADYVTFLYDTIYDVNNYKNADFFMDNFVHAFTLLEIIRADYQYKKWGGSVGQTETVTGLSIIKILTKIDIPETGYLQQLTTNDGNDSNDPLDLSELFGLMYSGPDAVTKAWTDPNEFMQDFIKAGELLQVLSENSGQGLSDYADLTGVYIRDYNTFGAVGSTAKMTQYEIDALFGMMFYADGSHSVAYDDPYGFLDGLTRAKNLLQAIQNGGEPAIAQILVLTGADFDPSTPMTPFKTGVLFNLMYDNTGTPTLAYSDPVAFVNNLLNDDNIYYVTALYEKLKMESALGYYNQTTGSNMTAAAMATGDFQILIDNLYGRRDANGVTLQNIIDLIGGSVVDGNGNNVDDRIDAFIADYVVDVKTLTPKANTLYGLLVSNNAFETFNMVTGAQLISTGTRPKDYAFLFSAMFNADGTHTAAYDTPNAYIAEQVDLVNHAHALFNAINNNNAFSEFNSVTGLNISGSAMQSTLLGVSFGAETIGDQIISPEWSSQFANFIYTLAQMYDGVDQAKYALYMQQYNSLISDITRYYNEDNVAPYAVYRDGSIYVGTTGHGWDTPNAEGGLASAYLGFSSVGYNPFVLGGGVSLSAAQQAQMYSYFSYFAGQANPSNGLIKTFYNPQGGQWQQEIMCSSYDLSLMIIGGSDALASKLITTLSTNGISASGGVLNNLWYDSSLVQEWSGWDWTVTGGNNAWVGIASIQYSYRTGDDKGLDFARNIANFLLTLQDLDGGMRMGPKGLWHDLNSLYPAGEGFYWNTKSLENNESILAFFDMMYEMTGEQQYKNTADQVYGWIKNMYDSSNDIFHRGMRYDDGTWKYDDVLLSEDTFATDTISWLPIQRMVEDVYFGATEEDRLASLERIYQEAFDRAGVSYTHLPKEVYEKMFGLMFDENSLHTDAYNDPDQYVIDLLAYINNSAELQIYYNGLSADEKVFFEEKFHEADGTAGFVAATDIPALTTQMYDTDGDGTYETPYDYATFAATFAKAYQLYTFYQGLSSAQKTNFENLYGLDMFVIVTQMYDLDGDGTYETPYDYATFTANFNGVSLLNDALIAEGLKDDFILFFVNGTTTYEQALFNISVDPSFTLAVFMDVFAKVAELDSALVAQSLKETFVQMFINADTTYVGELFNVAGDMYFDQASFMVILPKVNSLHIALSGAGAPDDPYEYREAFEMLYGIAIADQVPNANEMYRKYLFDIAGDPGRVDDPSTPDVDESIPAYDQATYLRVLPLAAEYHVLMHSYRDEFAQFYGIPVEDQDPVTNPAYRKLLFDVVGDPNYNRENIILIRIIALDLKIEDQGLRGDFHVMYGTPVAEQLFTNEAYRTLLAGILTDPQFVQTDFLIGLAASASLHNALNADRDNFASVYGIPAAQQDPVTNDAYRKLLFDITGDPEYDQADFIAGLAASSQLQQYYDALTEQQKDFWNDNFDQAISELSTQEGYDFNAFTQTFEKAFQLYSFYKSLSKLTADINEDGKVDASDVTILAGSWLKQEGDEGFNPKADINNDGIVNASDQSILASQWQQVEEDQLLFRELYGTDFFAIVTNADYDYAVYVAKFNSVRDLNNALLAVGLKDETEAVFEGSGMSYVEILASVVNDVSYDQDAFVNSVGKVFSLHNALDDSRENFAGIYSIDVADQNTANAEYRALLFSIVSDPLYNEEAFIGSLQQGSELHEALEGHRDAFETIFGIDVADQSMTNDQYATLLSNISNDPQFDLNAFITGLDKASSLHDALLVYDEEFNSVYGIGQMDPSDNIAYRTLLFNIVGGQGYDESVFVDALINAAELDVVLTEYALREAFADIYDVPVNQQKAGNDEYIGVLFGIVGSPAYDVDAFVDYFSGVIREFYDTGELKRRILPSGVIYEYYKSGVMKKETYPNVGINEYLDENFYGDMTGRLISKQEFDGYTYFYFDYYSGTDVAGKIELYGNNGKIFSTKFYYSTGVLQREERPDGSSEDYNADGILVYKVLSDGHEYGYDIQGRIISMIYPTGKYYEQDYENASYAGQVVRTVYSASDKTVLLQTEIYSYTDVYDQSTWLLESVIMPDGFTIEYDDLGRVTRELSPGAYTLDYEYYDLTTLIKKKTYTDLQTTYTVIYDYDPLGRLIKETIGEKDVIYRYHRWTDHFLYITVYVDDQFSYKLEYRQDGTLKYRTETDRTLYYDVYGRLKSVIINDISETFFFYANKDTLLYEKQIATDLVSGETVIYFYREDGSPEKTIDLAGWYAYYDTQGRVVREQTAYDVYVLYYYDGSSGQVSQKRIINTTSEQAILLTYDFNGVLIDQTYITDPVETYDGYGRLVEVVNYDTSSVVYTYHGVTADIESVVTTDMKGLSTTKIYDVSGRLLRQENYDDTWVEYTYEGSTSKVLREDFQDGSYNIYSYNVSTGALEAIVKVSAFNRATTEVYDIDTGLILEQRTWDNKVTSYTYDILNRLEKIDRYNGTSETYTYYGDTDNVHVKKLTYSSGYWYEYTYSEEGLLISRLYKSGTITTYSYDDLNRKIGEVSGNYTRTYEYEGDTDKLVTETSYYKGNLSSTSTYEYFPGSDILKTKLYTYSSGTWYKYEYDMHSGFITKMTSSFGYYNVYEYDEFGRISRTDSSYGYTTLFEYFGNSDQVKVMTYVDEQGRETFYEYNDLGKIVRSKGWYSVEEAHYSYDVYGRLLRIDFESGKYTLYTYYGDTNYTHEYNLYDADGTYLGGTSYEYYDDWRRKSYSYTSNGQTRVYEYLPNGRIDRIITSEGITDYQYDSSSRVSSIFYPNGEKTVYTYVGTSSRRASYTRYAADDSIISDEQWTYHGSSWIRATYKKTNSEGVVTFYEYNSKGRLIQVTTDYGTADAVVGTYTYDSRYRQSRIDYSNGDYQTKTYVGTTWKLDTMVQYYAEDDTSYTEEYFYYGDGTIKEKIITYRDGSTQNFFYDEGSVLLMEILPDGRVVFYSEYDDHGRNTRKDFGEGDYITIEYDEEGNPTETYHPAPTMEGDSSKDQQDNDVADMLNLQNANKDLDKKLEELGIGRSGSLGGSDGELVED